MRDCQILWGANFCGMAIFVGGNFCGVQNFVGWQFCGDANFCGSGGHFFLVNLEVMYCGLFIYSMHYIAIHGNSHTTKST